ncbi:adenosylmethionine--8-amino-7-oxononanoate transaminase [Flavobacteriales bacterium]|nr:adenosylmethionine--8-amino-7-oxononanoate transaminase [Flavobacteriales bacterium]
MNQEELIQFDKDHIWHPYTSMTHPIPAYVVESAKGVRIKLADGKELIDGMSSWWSTIHGYNHPELNQAINDQIQKVSHVMFGGLTHEPAVQLAKKLVNLSPEGLDKVFFADSGSVSVEIAIKMALQYSLGNGNKERTKIITLRKAYHGDTFGAMSLCDPNGGMHHLFEDLLAKQVFCPVPSTPFDEDLNKEDLQNLSAVFEKHGHEVSAFIIEPIVQGAGGMRIYSASFLIEVRRLCDKHNILLIADEIATGFGRTGELFACNHANISPDIMCLGKAITGGMMTFAATLCNSKVAEGISNSEASVLMHGPTFMGNPLACSVANKSLELLYKSNWKENVLRLEERIKENLKVFKGLNAVKSTRGLGAIGVIELNDNVDVAEAQKHFVENGIWLRPFRNLIYMMPPYIMENEDLDKIFDIIYSLLKKNELPVKT